MHRSGHRLSSFWTAVGIAAAALACSDQSPPANGPCNSTVTITVTASLTPTVSWSPACAVTLVRFYPTSGFDGATTNPNPVYNNPSVVWEVGAYQHAIVKPPIQFGVDPFAGREGDSLEAPQVPKPLVPGRMYLVQLYRSDPSGTGPGFEPARLHFTIPGVPRAPGSDPVPGTYVQLPPAGYTFPYYEKPIGTIYADTLTIFADHTYHTSGATASQSGVARSAFTPVGVDSSYFPHVGLGYDDMYVRIRGDTLVFQTDTVAQSVVHVDSTKFVRQ